MHSSGIWYDYLDGAGYGLVELVGAPDSDSDGVPDSLDVWPSDPLNAFDLREAGPDGDFDTADDEVYTLAIDPAYTSGTTVSLRATDGPLGTGRYRFTANSTITDKVGNPLDGDGDGTGGDAYRRVFEIALDPAAIFEGRYNNDIAHATALALVDEPGVAGLSFGRGIGTHDPAGDWDYYSFEAAAGERVSIALRDGGYGYSSIYLFNAAGGAS